MNIKKGFLQAVGVSALALITAFAPPAMAGKDFFKKDCTSHSTEFCQIAGQRISNNEEKGYPLTLVVHGGERESQMAAYRVAQRLDEEGVNVAFLLAPDHDEDMNSMVVAFYTKGGTQYSSAVLGNGGNLSTYEEDLYTHALKAYREEFPQPLVLKAD